VALRLALSVTFTVKENVPAAVGVPDSRPPPLVSVMPGGRLPALTVHVNGLVPPVTTSWSL
jgi:hypothetical protein